MKAQVVVRLKPSVLDPQGTAVARTLKGIGFPGVESVRQGKLFEIELAATSKDAAIAELKQMSEKLLANMVIEAFEINVIEP